MNTNFKVFDLTRLGIKPESTAQETDAHLPTRNQTRIYSSKVSLKAVLFRIKKKKFKAVPERISTLSDALKRLYETIKRLGQNCW